MRKPSPIALQIDVESAQTRDDHWRYRIVIENGNERRCYAVGRGTPEHVLDLMKEALRKEQEGRLREK